MSITPEEAATIRSEQSFLRDQLSQLVSALHENTTQTGEMLLELKERDVRDEYREKEFTELKDAVLSVNEKIDKYIIEKQPIIDWAKRKKEFYDGLYEGIRSTWGKMAGALIIIAIATALGLDLSSILK